MGSTFSKTMVSGPSKAGVVSIYNISAAMFFFSLFQALNSLQTFSNLVGTPNNNRLRSPLLTKGCKNSANLSVPILQSTCISTKKAYTSIMKGSLIKIFLPPGKEVCLEGGLERQGLINRGGGGGLY